MTRVVLIAAPYPLDECPSPPLGLCYAAAAFETAGAEVHLLDYIVREYSPEKLREELTAISPDIIGTSCVTMNFTGAAAILTEARAICPDAVILMGGPHASFDIDDTLAHYPAIDGIVVGEAEETLKELTDLFHQRETWKNIAGLAFRRGSTVVHTPKRDFIQDLDTLPLPARHLLPLARYKALGFPVSIITGRGCPNRCIFCLGRKMVGFHVRQRSPQRVADEIESLLAMGFATINIADDLFTASRKRVFAFCREIKKRGLVFNWSVFARVNTVDEELLRTMMEAGCTSVSFGIESGNTEMLKRVRKGISIAQAENAAALCRKVGIRAHASFIAGLPGESRETLEESVALKNRLKIEYGFHHLAPFPGTTVREQMADYDLTLHSNDWDLYDADQAIVSTSHLTSAEIDAFVREDALPIHQAWDAARARCESGTATKDDELMVLGNRRMHLIFKLLRRDLLDTLSPLPEGLKKALHSAAEILAGLTDETPDFTEFTLKDLVERGWVTFHADQGTGRFHWAEETPCPEIGHRKKAG
ncbi:B12-binding domain-containing radical SAM protein [Desulfoluna spongiiphila]|uniref:Radical SAM superfamily enzyme YgiQ, UPF0313 family n=1 Tax=Desulfoluna spongiiphila TaxID=419481 RepID=A0A1G5DA32_9BACT|nr:radical SAM protein [Desulfoluna spongiiphila]SCY11535.1 Radical SAM superfamily enzyme YgiQ, UPF0313 family [Desulfoluna spongiiphila]